jgi:hypothetical protein
MNLRYWFLSIVFTFLAMASFAPADTTAKLDKTRLPYFFDHAPYVSPKILQDLSTWMPDYGDQVVTINLSDLKDTNRYYADIKTRKIEGQPLYIYFSEKPTKKDPLNRGEFGYQYIGQTSSGIFVLETTDWGGGTEITERLMLVTFEKDRGMTVDWNDKTIHAGRERLLLKKVGEIELGDHWQGELKVVGNKLLIGKYDGKTPVTSSDEIEGRKLGVSYWMDIDLTTAASGSQTK